MIGDPKTLTVSHWGGDAPELGECIASARGRFAYRIIGIRRSRAGSRSWGRLDCLRFPRSELTEADVVHVWEWAGR